MIIGFSLSFQREFLTWPGSGGARCGRQGVIPRIILFLALLFLPQARIEGRRLAQGRHAAGPDACKRAVVGFGVLFVVIVFLLPRSLADRRPDVRASRLARRDRVHHAVARPAHRLVRADLVRAGHLRRRRRVGRRSSSRAAAATCSGSSCIPPGSPLAARVVARSSRCPIGVLMALARAATPGPVPRPGDDGVRVDRRSSSSTSPRCSAAPGARSIRLSCSATSSTEPFTLLGHRLPPRTPGSLHVHDVDVLRLRLRDRRAAARHVRAAAHGDAGQPGRVRHARREPAHDQARGVRAVGRRSPASVVRCSACTAATSQTTNFDLLPGLDGAGSRRCSCSWSAASSVVSGALFGAALLQIVHEVPADHAGSPDVKPIQWWSQVGPGLAGIGIAPPARGRRSRRSATT